MKTTTALDTPIPPRSSATSATSPRYRVSRESASFRLFWSSATVRICDSLRPEDLAVSVGQAWADVPGGKLEIRLVFRPRPETQQLVSAEDTGRE